MSVDLDGLMNQFASMAPGVRIGRGPQHPASPQRELAEQTERWFRLYPFIQRDAGYADFLLRYSGAEAVVSETGFEVLIAGFTGFGGVLNEVGPFTYDDETSGIDAEGLYPFAVVGMKPEAMEFCFDATGRRPWGVYRRYYKPRFLEGQEEWYCGTFLEWLAEVVESRGIRRSV